MLSGPILHERHCCRRAGSLLHRFVLSCYVRLSLDHHRGQEGARGEILGVLIDKQKRYERHPENIKYVFKQLEFTSRLVFVTNTMKLWGHNLSQLTTTTTLLLLIREKFKIYVNKKKHFCVLDIFFPVKR